MHVTKWTAKANSILCMSSKTKCVIAPIHAMRATAVPIQYSTVQYSTVQYSTVQYSTVQYSTVQYSTKDNST
jgi:hypothetical protein